MSELIRYGLVWLWAGTLLAFAVTAAIVELARQRRECRICGCTDRRACEEGCEWVDSDLCSACERMIAEVAW